MIDRTPLQMHQEASMWSQAGYPSVAIARYRDAAEQIKHLMAEMKEDESRMYVERGRNVVLATELKTAEARIATLDAALREAKEVIKTWHNMGDDDAKRMAEVWQIYDRASPEMKRINAALAGSQSDAEAMP